MTVSYMNISTFCEKEGITLSFFLSPARIYEFLLRHRFLHFFVVGVCGVGANLFVTWILTAFVFGISGYFTAFLFGVAANFAFNFTLYTVAVFKTTSGHVRRLVLFLAYSIPMTYLQIQTVHVVTPVVGVRFYLPVIAGTVLFFSVINFFVFKLSIFRQEMPPRV